MLYFIKSIFQNKISLKQIKEIEKEIIEKLNNYDQNFEIIYREEISEITNIYFTFKPKGISLMRVIKNQKKHYDLEKTFNQIMNINGIEFYNRNLKTFQSIPCSFTNYQLQFIEYEKPEKFHKIFDTNKIIIKNLNFQKITIKNPDREIVEKILNIKNDNEIKKLDLECCFEIELEDNKFYTILDFENGNYIGVDKKGKIYFLDHKNDVRKIHENIGEFLSEFDGNKLDLEKKLE